MRFKSIPVKAWKEEPGNKRKRKNSDCGGCCCSDRVTSVSTKTRQNILPFFFVFLFFFFFFFFSHSSLFFFFSPPSSIFLFVWFGAAASGVTIVFSEGLELSDNENDAEFDEMEPQDFHHPLEGHPDIPPVSQLQHAIAEVIFSAAGSDSGLQAIQNAVAKKARTLKRRDMTDYPPGELKKAVVEVLRPNPRIPNLFRKEENSRAERYRCNVTADEAVESMKKARKEKS